MHIALVSGSHRAASESSRVAKWLAARLPILAPGTTADLIDLAGNPLPLWDESFYVKDSPLQRQWEPYAQRLRAADGLAFVVPEWSGMVPAGFKNFLLYTTPREVGHKPTLIVAVSAGMGGAYVVTELRSSSCKNTRQLYVPEHLILRNVASLLKDPTPSGKEDASLRARADFALTTLVAYAQALKPVRESGVFFDPAWPFGM